MTKWPDQAQYGLKHKGEGASAFFETGLVE